MDQKRALRSRLKAQRKHLSEAEVMAKSSAIVNKLIRLVDWESIDYVHVYRTNPEWREVDTQPLVTWLQENHPTLKIIQPSKDRLQAIPNIKFDLVIVPVLAFDSRNNRLGMGGGYYDRFLATQPDALKVGIAYSWAFRNSLPHEPHDIRLDKVITEV